MRAFFLMCVVLMGAMAQPYDPLATIEGMLPWNWDANQWNVELKTATEAAVNESNVSWCVLLFFSSTFFVVPIIGSFLSFFIDIFWPDPQVDAWKGIMEQMEKNVLTIVDASILKFEINQLKGSFESVRGELTEYNRTDIPLRERAQALFNAIDRCNAIYNHIDMSDERLQLYPLMVPLSSLHMVALREMYLHGPELYNQSFISPGWISDLRKYFSQYTEWIDKNYEAWLAWRSQQIDALASEASSSSMCHIPSSGPDCCWQWSSTDAVTQTQRKNDVAGLCSRAEAQSWAFGTKTALLNEAIAQLAITLEPMFYLFRYVPFMSNQSDPVLPPFVANGTTLGPYAGTGNTLAGRDLPLALDKPGEVTGVRGAAFNSVDKLQFIYENHVGHYVGDSGGTPFAFNLTVTVSILMVPFHSHP
jgi:hypothetical protein